VLKNNLFIICKTPMAKSITRRTLAGFREGVKVNAHYFEDLINQITNKKQQFIERVTNAQGYWGLKNIKEMKFNAVVGNPPYQSATDASNRQEPIYHLFYDIAFSLSNKVSLISPARFLFKAGQTPKEWMNKVLNDEHFKVVRYAQDSKEIFSGVDIKGGVAITFRDCSQNFGKIGTYAIHSEISSILEKVTNHDFTPFSDIVFTKSSYSFTSTLYDENPNLVGRLTRSNENIVDASIFSKMPEIFVDTNPDVTNFIGVMGRDDKGRVLKYTKRSYLTPIKNFDQYKVFITGANGSGAFGETLSQPIIAEPMVAHTQTFMSIGGYNSLDEAKACLKYVKSKFFRCLLGTLKVTQNNNKDTFANIPLQDFTTNSDIDWSKSVAEIDQQLYDKYDLSADEREFIEKMIKPMQ